jgi:hypothetical protein
MTRAISSVTKSRALKSGDFRLFVDANIPGFRWCAPRGISKTTKHSGHSDPGGQPDQNRAQAGFSMLFNQIPEPQRVGGSAIQETLWHNHRTT